jgi:DNA-binding NtrC family response regulator
MTLLIPPLRERGNDILKLADAILQRTCRRLKTPMLLFGQSASRAIADYSWPGNVRELENAIERAVVLAESQEIGEDLLAIDNDDPEAEVETAGFDPDMRAANPVEELSLEDYFQRFVLEHQDSMNETKLAKKLGISRKCLWERRQRFGIPRKKRTSS